MHDEENNDPHTSTSFLARPYHILQMTSQSIAADVTITQKFWSEHVNSEI